MKLFQRNAAVEPAPRPRLHIGCGQEAMPGWVNIDNRALPGVDQVLDVRQGLPFQDVETIYAEHFLEHLSFDDGFAFLKECRRALAAPGILRLSTPNLDWVYATHYRPWQTTAPEEMLRDCFQLNRAFHGWGHQFLYNRPALEAVLKASGFASVVFHRYGESDVAALRGVEKHQTWEDTPEMPHVLIVEASGRSREEPLPARMLEEFREAIATR